MGTAVRPAKTSPGPWDAFADVDVFVDEVLAELTAMARDGTRPQRSGPKPPLAGAALRKAVMAFWCVCFAVCSGGPSDSSAISPSTRCHPRFQEFRTQNSTRFFFVPVDFADAGMRGGGRALSDG
jgi:hypothetical protein